MKLLLLLQNNKVTTNSSSWTDKGKLVCVVKMWNNDETSPTIDLNDRHIWWNMFFVQMVAGFMEKVQSLSRSRTHDS